MSDLVPYRRNFRRNHDRSLFLHDLLSEALTLELVVRRAHWGVTGPSFQGLHALFDDIYKAAADYADLIAERIRQLGGSVEGIDPKREHIVVGSVDAPGRRQSERVVDALESFIGASYGAFSVAEENQDQATVDILAEIIRGAEKNRWLVKSHLEPKDLRFNGPHRKTWRR